MIQSKRFAKRFAERFAKRFLFVLVAAAFACSVLPHVGYAYTPEEQQACQGDAFRLCGPEIPDVDRVTACMVKKKAQLSPGCAVCWSREYRAGRLLNAGRQDRCRRLLRLTAVRSPG